MSKSLPNDFAAEHHRLVRPFTELVWVSWMQLN